MKIYTVRIYLSIIIIGITSWLSAQNWLQAHQWGSNGNDISGGLAACSDGGVVLAGTFQQNVLIGNQILPSAGMDDILLLRTDAEGRPVWAKRAGGSLNETVTALATDASDNIICAGSFLISAEFDDFSLNAEQNPRALFLVKYTPNGQAQWAQSIEGPGLKSITGLACDTAGNIFLTGFFGQTLSLGDTLLRAEGDTDFFAAKLSPEGTLHWALRQGLQGDTRGTALALTASSDLIVAGYFNDTTRIADTVLTANTADRDLFLTCISTEGQPRWAKKAGGVFDKDVTAIAIDETDRIYLIGYLVGVLRLSAELSIQSATGNPDFFLLQYAPDGTPLRARALGGRDTQQAMGAYWQEGQLVVAGFYQGEMTFDGFSFAAGTRFHGFRAVFNEAFVCQEAQDIPATQGAFVSHMVPGAAGESWVSGSFQGQVFFDEIELSASTGFDIFLAKAGSMPTSALDFAIKNIHWQAFPNPATELLFLQTNATDYTATLYDAQGRAVRQVRNSESLPVHDLPAGIYWLQWQSLAAKHTQKIIVQKKR